MFWGASMPGLLRFWRGVLIWLGWLLPLAAPAQVPPADFGAALFIDAGGCVRERDGAGWRLRLLPDGAPDCGYPPTPLPEPPPRDADLPLPPGMGEAEGRLLTTLAEGLRPGDFLPPDPVAPPPAMPGHPAMRAIQTALSDQGIAARAALSGGRPNARLCALIGQGGAMGGGLGADPSRGFCPGEAPGLITAALRPAAALPIRPQVPPPAKAAVEGAASAGRIDRPADAGAPADAAPVAAPRGAPLPRPAVAVPAPASAPAPAPAVAPGPRRALVVDERMIPAGARYLQLGGAVDAEAAQAGFVRVAALGLPAARGRVPGGEGVLVMAGPFDSRQAIVRAYARLRGAGFAQIEPR